jgi:multidrug resistance efflux pump
MDRKNAVLIATVLLLGLAAYVWASSRPKPLVASGTVEARDIRVGSKVGGRIEQVLVREGDRVEAGQVLATFDDRELKANLDASLANLQKLQHGFRSEEVEQARAEAAQAQSDYALKQNGARQEDIAAAQADLDRTRADSGRAESTWKRVSDLSNQDVFSKQQRDDAEGAWKNATATQRAAEQRLAALQHGFRPEEVASAEHRYHQAAAKAQEYVQGSRREDIAQAKAQHEYDEARYRERQVVAPAASTVEVMAIRPGDLIAPNAPIVTLLERDQLYIRIYVPETEIGRVKLGQKATVTLDALPEQIFEGEVQQINQQSEFLPRNVQTREERVHQMVGVKIRMHDSDGKIRSGMAADVRLADVKSKEIQ